MSTRLVNTLIVAVLLVLTGCNGTLLTTILKPAQVETLSKVENDEATFSCFPFTCFHTHGTGCFAGPLSPGGMQVGHSWHYEAGTPPCNCWWWVDCAFRGAVRFDLSDFQPNLGDNDQDQIVSAVLKWQHKGACAARLFVRDDALGTWVVSEEIASPWPPNTSGAGQIDVSILVRNRVLADKYDVDFVFVGEDESFPADTNSVCLSEVTGLELQVVYKN